ncbi:MAG TPA: peptide ABC transporter substrate-binding protein [bacterium]|nr:peptide ABC transporter substrate-binding protein [bacterium]HPT29421.1 peptide ABC transporter substrate-binding protein [bacterium]
MMNSSDNNLVAKLKRLGQNWLAKFFSLFKKNKVVNPDHQLVYSLAPHKVPRLQQLKYLTKVLNTKERRWFFGASLVLVIALIVFAVNFVKTHLELAPARGGEYTEAIVGYPKYINPLYNFNRDIDTDISRLIFSSLFKRDDAGVMQPDLVSEYSISADGKAYTLKIRDDVKFHNGTKLTVDDIMFTFSAIKDPAYDSPYRQVFLGAEIERVDDNTVQFNLAEPYSAFTELLSFGILSQELWGNVDPETASLSDFNLKPVGSGPFVFHSLSKSKNGEMKNYVLEANDDYYDHTPYLDQITLKFYPNISEAISALNSNEVDGLSYLPISQKKEVLAKNSLHFYNIPWPQLSALFFNKKGNVFLADTKVRQALTLALDRNQIISDVFGDSAEVADGPIWNHSFAITPDFPKQGFDPAQADKILTDAGWEKVEISAETEKEIKEATPEKIKADSNLEFKVDLADVASSTGATLTGSWRVKFPAKKTQGRQYLVVSITTSDSAENMAVAEKVKQIWESLGVKVILKSVPADQIVDKVIAPRDFSILLFGESLGGDPDVYAFWHSSQAGATGLNLADYRNTTADALLESGRMLKSLEDRIVKYRKFQETVLNDVPAAFLYSAKYIYPQSKNIKGFKNSAIVDPSDRLNDAVNWYVKTRKKFHF